MPAATDIRTVIGTALRAAADPERAPQQQAYMKSEMPFLGVAAPQCRRIAASAFRAHPLPDADAWEAAILGLWLRPAFREERYAAVELLNLPRCSPWIEPRRVPLIEELVITGAWWDYVDAIAGRAVGAMLASHPRPTKTLRAGALAESEEAPAEALLPWLSTGTRVPADRGCCGFPLRQPGAWRQRTPTDPTDGPESGATLWS